MRTTDSINTARWWKRQPTKTAAKIQAKLPDSKVEVAWHMVHERSNGGNAYTIKITTGTTVAYLAS